MKGFNAPGKFSRSPKSLHAAILNETEQPGASFGFATEVASPERAAVLDFPGWTTTHFPGRGKGECAIFTKDKLRKVVHTELLQLTDGTGKGRFNVPLCAPVVITDAPSGRRTLFTDAHLPAHIETLWRAIPLPQRTKFKLLAKNKSLSPVIQTYVHAVLEWKKQVTELAARFNCDDIVVGADWNLNGFAKWVRQLFANAWPGLTLAHTPGGDLGKRNVGWLLTSMDFVDGSQHKTPASDHEVGRFELKHLNAPHPPDPKPVPKPLNPPPPFELCTYHGARMDQKTMLAVQILERDELHDLAPLTIYQGCYNPGGVSASAGTHDKGGVLDFAPAFFGRKVKAWRTNFGPGWHRLTIVGLWEEHIHVVIEDQGNLAPMAAQQVVEYHNGEDGLADHARDPNQFHPEVSYSYEAEWKKMHAA